MKKVKKMREMRESEKNEKSEKFEKNARNPRTPVSVHVLANFWIFQPYRNRASYPSLPTALGTRS